VGEGVGSSAEYSRRLDRGPRQPHPAHAGSSAGCGCQTLADRIPGRLAGEKRARGEHRPEGARPCEDSVRRGRAGGTGEEESGDGRPEAEGEKTTIDPLPPADLSRTLAAAPALTADPLTALLPA